MHLWITGSLDDVLCCVLSLRQDGVSGERSPGADLAESTATLWKFTSREPLRMRENWQIPVPVISELHRNSSLPNQVRPALNPLSFIPFQG